MSNVEPGVFISMGESDRNTVALLNNIFQTATRNGASDIHLESIESGMVIRARINGKMHEMHRIDDRWAADEVDMKVRMKARISLSDRSIPHDSRMYLEVDERPIDVRVSILPTRTGQSIVCRLLDQNNARRKLSDIEMTDAVRSVFQGCLDEPNGMILLTGPTGSGKTSTLYAGLNHFSASEHKILTLEDPVEYRVEGANQVNIETQAGLTFAKALRSAMRQDPDIILVGEIRDSETAQIAAQAALTGHLVLSTLHANDAGSTITRMIELGVEPFVLGIALKMVVAQRLVPALCPSCRIMVKPSSYYQHWIAAHGGDPNALYGAMGEPCVKCNGLGVAGRLPVMECIVIDKEVRHSAEKVDYSGIVEAARKQPQFESLAQAGIRLAMEGRISLDQARAIGGE